MEIAFHCPNCLADLIYDESKRYTCCFCHTVLDESNEVKELEGGYYVGDAWNDKVYHSFHCEDCGADYIAKPGSPNACCPLCSSTSTKDNGGIIGAMPRRVIPFTHTRQEAQEKFLDYIRNNSAVGRTLATDENKELLHKVYVPIWLFTYEVLAHAKVTAMIRNKANESKTLFGINGTEGIAEGISESLSAIRSSFSRFQKNKKNASKETASGEQPSEHITGGVLSWQGIPFDASGVLPTNVINSLQPYDQSKMVLLNDKVLMDTPVLMMTKDPISCMQEFMDRIKKWTRQMIMDAHSDSYDISYFQDKTDYPLGIGELVLFPIWYMKGEYMGRDFFYAMNGQNGEVDANIPMSKGTAKSSGITYQQYWDKSRCTALTDTHFEFNIHDPSIEILDYSFFEKPKESRVTPNGRLDMDTSKARTSLDSVFETSEDEPKPESEKTKKKFSELEMEYGFGKRKDPDKQLTKEEELQREREMIARLAVAAREEPKGDMAAATSVPSWAKAVTPPPSANTTSARPARTKKVGGGMKSSAASSANKPLWEKTEEELAAERNPNKERASSMASHMARGGEEVSPFAANPNIDVSDMTLEDLDKMPVQQDTYMKVPDKYKTPAPEEKAFREQLVSSSSRDIEEPESYEIPMPKIAKEKKEQPKPIFKAPEYEEPVYEEEPVVEEPVIEEPVEEEEMVANITFSFNKKKPVMDSEERVTDAAPIPRQLERAPAEQRGMSIMNSEYDSGVLRHTEVQHEVDEGEVREILPKTQLNATEYYRGSEENDVPLKYRPAAPLANAMSNMNIEYNDRVDLNPEDDENNRPLATRPPAPLARATEQGPSLEYMTEQPLDEEIHPMHSLEADKPRWGEMPEAKETPSWAKPQQDSSSAFVSPRNRGRNYLSKEELRAASEEAARRASAAPRSNRRPRSLAEAKQESEEYADQRPGLRPENNGPRSLERGSREVEATVRASVAVNRNGPRTLARSSQDEEVSERASSGVNRNGPRTLGRNDDTPDMSGIFKPAGRPGAAFAQREEQEEDDRPALARMAPRQESEPAPTRPAGRPGAFRASREEESAKPQKNVPIWERVPETDGPVPAWGSSAAYVDDDRPLGSLSKPKDQIIDVEKPRERPSLWGPSGSDSEVLPSARREAEEERPSPRRPSPPPRAREINRPASREITPERPAREIEARPAREIEARPRTFAQRRQMEEEERRRQIQSSFANPEKETPRTPFRRPANMIDEEPEDSEPVNRTFESTQFEDKPSVVASLDMLPEPLGEESIHHLAKEREIPALARDAERYRQELEEAEMKAEQRMQRGLSDYDPDGPSPFKPY
ncbi:MAG: hypothetical protein J6Y58_02520 [Clostridiales bacterium]|nr:hypothetical protein [Clostridiales bacterium]